MTPHAAPLVTAISAALLSFAPLARAEEPAAAAPAASERIALVYSAPPECPGDDGFRDLVRARVTGSWEAAPGELARRISVSVAARGAGYFAAIEFLNAEGQKVTRTVAGKSCTDVVDGIALVTALAIESRVDEAIQQSEPDQPAASPMPAKPPVPAPKAAPTEIPPRRPASRAHLRFGGALAVATGVGPAPSFGPALFSAIEWHGPRVGIVGEGFWSGTVLANGVKARFRRLAARLEGCPWSGAAGALSFEPCALFEVGSIRGDGVLDPPRVVSASGGASLWLAPGALVRLLMSFEPVVVTLDASVRFPLVRQTFGVVTAGNPEPYKVYEVPPVAFGGALGLGLRL